MQRNNREALFKLSIDTFRWRKYFCSRSLIKDWLLDVGSKIWSPGLRTYSALLQMTGQGRTTEYTAESIHITV